MDPNRWTLKTQEAVNAAVSRAAADNNPEVTPDHLLPARLFPESAPETAPARGFRTVRDTAP